MPGTDRKYVSWWWANIHNIYIILYISYIYIYNEKIHIQAHKFKKKIHILRLIQDIEI